MATTAPTTWPQTPRSSRAPWAGRCACSGWGATGTPGNRRGRRWSCRRGAPSTATATPWRGSTRCGAPRTPRDHGATPARPWPGSFRACPSRFPSSAVTGMLATVMKSTTSVSFVIHWLADMPLRVSALRGLGAPQNTFANESFIDELAAVAGADPVDFRLRHLRDQRAIDVVRAAASLASWQPRIGSAARAENPIARGRGFAYAKYEYENAYVATVADVEVDRRTGAIRVRRVFVAHDCGLIVNPDGVRNQIEGNVVQTLSRTLKEEVRFDRGRVTSLDWQSYPLLRFSEVPEAIEIALIDRPDRPSVGAGEPAACPVPAAVANAVFDATGARLRRVPFTLERVKAALHT